MARYESCSELLDQFLKAAGNLASKDWLFGVRMRQKTCENFILVAIGAKPNNRVMK